MNVKIIFFLTIIMEENDSLDTIHCLYLLLVGCMESLYELIEATHSLRAALNAEQGGLLTDIQKLKGAQDLYSSANKEFVEAMNASLITQEALSFLRETVANAMVNVCKAITTLIDQKRLVRKKLISDEGLDQGMEENPGLDTQLEILREFYLFISEYHSDIKVREENAHLERGGAHRVYRSNVDVKNSINLTKEKVLHEIQQRHMRSSNGTK